MHIKYLQLNMYMGKNIDILLPYLQKEQFDILSIQEISGGEVSFGNRNYFKEIADLGYEGELLVTWRFTNKPHSFFGQAVFWKPGFTMLHKDEIWLKPYMNIPTLEGFKFEEFPKAVLGVTLEKDGKKFVAVSSHLAWSPVAHDTPEKVLQAKIFKEYMATIDKSFIMSGDFNSAPDTEVVRMFDGFGRNLTEENTITNTMNLRLHRNADTLTKSGGVAVDYIFVSNDINIKKFEVLENLDLSDHFGLYLECDI